MASKDGRILPINRQQQSKVNRSSLATSNNGNGNVFNEASHDLLRKTQVPFQPAPRKIVVHEKKATARSRTYNDGVDDAGSGCLICGIDNDHGKLLLCEVCNGEYHIYCLAPPLNSIPENEWYCDRCKHIDNLDAMVAVLPESYTSRFGEICWAQGGVGYGWWPSCIYDPRLTIGAARIQAIKNLGKRHLVYFFECTEAPFEILPDSKIMLWEQGILEDCHLGKTAKASSKGRLAAFRCALHAASIEESKQREYRLDWNHQGSLTLFPSRASSPVHAMKEQKKERNKQLALQSTGNPREIEKNPPQSTGAEFFADSEPSGQQSRPNKKLREASLRRAPKEVVTSTLDAPCFAVESDADGEMYCTVSRERGGTDGKTSLGFVRIQSRKKSTFAQLRRGIESDLVPDAIPSGWEWRFLLPTLGPLSIKQESKFGPLLPFLLQMSGPDEVGEGTLQNPVQIVVVEKRNDLGGNNLG